MVSRRSKCAWILFASLGGVLLATTGLALTDADVDQLGKECEAARQVALAPIREQRTQACIDQQLRSKEHCERYYATYGNVAPSSTGAPVGYFYDLPECKEWLAARDTLRVSRSRPQ